MSKRKHPRSVPLMEEPAVRELLEVMKQHNSPGRGDLLAMCQQIAGLEQQLNSALEELSVMRQELAQARESPVKRALQKTVAGLEKVTNGLWGRLDSLKEKVVEGCKKTLAAFRERGVSALAHTAEFLHIRPALEGISRELEKNIVFDDRALSIIEAASKEYHEAGRHLKNIVRAVQGREARSKGARRSGPWALAPLSARSAVDVRDAEPDGWGAQTPGTLGAGGPAPDPPDNGRMCKAGKSPGKQGTGGPRREPGGPVTYGHFVQRR